MTTIKLLGAEWEPALPASFLARYEVASVAGRSTKERAGVAALGLTWAHPEKRLKANYTASGPDPIRYADTVMTEVIGLGATPLEIYRAAAVAYVAVVASIPTQEEVERQAAFSGASSTGNPDAGNGDADEK